MTHFRKKINQKNMFQNLKMVDKILKMTLKSLTEENTSKDILDKVFDLKQKVTDLEQIAREFSNRKENDMEAKSFDNNKDTEIPIQTKHHIIQCDLCRRKFQNVSNLEKHIKRYHTEYETYECDHCSKTFVTKWRLEKHKKMHSTMKIVQCRYFRNNLVCPFEELGCKFWHDADIQVTDASDTSEIAIKDSSIVTSNSGQT